MLIVKNLAAPPLMLKMAKSTCIAEKSPNLTKMELSYLKIQVLKLASSRNNVTKNTSKVMNQPTTSAVKLSVLRILKYRKL